MTYFQHVQKVATKSHAKSWQMLPKLAKSWQKPAKKWQKIGVWRVGFYFNFAESGITVKR